MSVNDGKTLWDKDVTGRILSSITIGPKSLYVTTDDNKVFSLSKDGTIVAVSSPYRFTNMGIVKIYKYSNEKFLRRY